MTAAGAEGGLKRRGRSAQLCNINAGGDSDSGAGSKPELVLRMGPEGMAAGAQQGMALRIGPELCAVAKAETPLSYDHWEPMTDAC